MVMWTQANPLNACFADYVILMRCSTRPAEISQNGQVEAETGRDSQPGSIRRMCIHLITCDWKIM